jgi:hypothetical protein
MAILNTSLTTIPTAISPVLTTDSAVTVIFFCNLNVPDPLDSNLGKEYIDIFAVPSGNIPLPINQIAKQIPVDAGDTFTFSAERLVLGPNDRIHASTSTLNAVSVTISYVVI